MLYNQLKIIHGMVFKIVEETLKDGIRMGQIIEYQHGVKKCSTCFSNGNLQSVTTYQ